MACRTSSSESVLHHYLENDMSDLHDPSMPRPTALIDFPRLEEGHVWLMAVMVGLSRGPLNPDVLEDADEVVAKYKQKFGF